MRTRAGVRSSPHPSPPACRLTSRVLAASAEASPAVSGQPTPGVVSCDCSGSCRHPLSKPAVAVGTPTCCPGGPAELEGHPLWDSCPHGRGCQADHGPEGLLPAVMGPSPPTRPSSLQVTGADSKSGPTGLFHSSFTRCALTGSAHDDLISRGTTRISGSLSCGAREVRSPCAWRGG